MPSNRPLSSSLSMSISSLFFLSFLLFLSPQLISCQFLRSKPSIGFNESALNMFWPWGHANMKGYRYDPIAPLDKAHSALFIVLAGLGEIGNDPNLLFANGCGYYFNNGQLKPRFTVNGETFAVTCLALQLQGAPTQYLTDWFIGFVAQYRSRFSSLHISTLSLSAGNFQWLTETVSGHLMAEWVDSMVGFSGFYNCFGPSWVAPFKTAIARGVALWVQTNEVETNYLVGDSQGVPYRSRGVRDTLNQAYNELLQANVPNIKQPRYTEYAGATGHDSWTQHNNPQKTPDADNAWIWALSNRRSSNLQFVPPMPICPGSGSSTTGFCASQPCLNCGNCSNLATGYSCSCTPGYEGSNCEFGGNPYGQRPNLCAPFGDVQCLNWGACTQTGTKLGDYVCSCPPEWTGARCNISTQAGSSSSTAGASGGSATSSSSVIGSSTAVPLSSTQIFSTSTGSPAVSSSVAVSSSFSSSPRISSSAASSTILSLSSSIAQASSSFSSLSSTASRSSSSIPASVTSTAAATSSAYSSSGASSSSSSAGARSSSTSSLSSSSSPRSSASSSVIPTASSSQSSLVSSSLLSSSASSTAASPSASSVSSLQCVSNCSASDPAVAGDSTNFLGVSAIVSSTLDLYLFIIAVVVVVGLLVLTGWRCRRRAGQKDSTSGFYSVELGSRTPGGHVRSPTEQNWRSNPINQRSFIV